jgi:hypothetical protein
MIIAASDLNVALARSGKAARTITLPVEVRPVHDPGPESWRAGPARLGDRTSVPRAVRSRGGHLVGVFGDLDVARTLRLSLVDGLDLGGDHLFTPSGRLPAPPAARARPRLGADRGAGPGVQAHQTRSRSPLFHCLAQYPRPNSSEDSNAPRRRLSAGGATQQLRGSTAGSLALAGTSPSSRHGRRALRVPPTATRVAVPAVS